MKSWSDRPFAPVTQLPDVAAIGAEIAGENGQSSMVYESAAHPGWLVKRYKPGFPEEPPEVLDRLIGLPARMSAGDLSIVDSATCWPVSRVVSGGATVGVVLAKAPEQFFTTVRTPFGPPEKVALNLDQLVQTDPDFYEARELAVPDHELRLRVARNLLRVGALLERHDVVYADWSYANLFWESGSGRIFLIDMDTCGLSSRPWVECNSWNDPAVAPGERLTVHTDRYKLAVAVLRSLTGVRGEDPRPALAALRPELGAGPFGAALRCSLDDPPELRPSSVELLELLESELDPRPGARRVGAANDAVARRTDTERRTVPGRPAPRPQRSGDRGAVPSPATRPVPERRTTRTSAPSRPIEHDPFDAAPPIGLERLLMPLITVCLFLLVLLLLAGAASVLFP